MTMNIFDEVAEELRTRHLYESDRHFSVYWLGGSHSYIGMLRKRGKASPSGAMLLRFADRLNSHGLYALGSKLHGYAMDVVTKGR